ncbi:MAG: hypothetical protein JW915_15120 [Chitinispirillaceae bacterium]|nr:hypothetical protein [Chitinispirillaceae bacterium]
MNNAISGPIQKKHSVFSHLLKFLGWWFGFAGLYATFSVCPFCGQAGCPVGVGATGIFGGVFALIVKGKSLYLVIISKFKIQKLNAKKNNHAICFDGKDDLTE